MPSRQPRPLDPELRARLLQEVHAPWRGCAGPLWFAPAPRPAIGPGHHGSAGSSAGGELGSGDLLHSRSVRCCSSVLLLWRDRTVPRPHEQLSESGSGSKQGQPQASAVALAAPLAPGGLAVASFWEAGAQQPRAEQRCHLPELSKGQAAATGPPRLLRRGEGRSRAMGPDCAETQHRAPEPSPAAASQFQRPNGR